MSKEWKLQGKLRFLSSSGAQKILQRFPHHNPQNMLLYMAKETLQMWLRILRWEEYSVLSVWVLCAYKYPFKRKTIGWKSDKMWGLEANVRMMHFEDGGRDYEPKNAGNPWKLGKETISSRNSRRILG